MRTNKEAGLTLRASKDAGLVARIWKEAGLALRIRRGLNLRNWLAEVYKTVFSF